MQTPSIKDTETFDKFKALIEKLKTSKEKILLIHDADGDGLSSGKILIESMQKLGIKIKFRFVAYDRTNLFGDFLMEFIDKNRITTIFTTDVGIYSTNFKDKKELLKDKTFVMFDHHEKPEIIDTNVLYFHPISTYGFNEPSQYCSSKLVYDIMTNFVDIKELNWVASIGIVADANHPTWGDFVDKTLKELGLPIPESAFDSILQKVGTFLYYALAIDKEAADKAVKAYFAAHSYQEALESLKGYEVVGEEIEYFLQNWKKYSEEQQDIIFIVIEPKYKVNSLVSSKISNLFPYKTILVGSMGKTKNKMMSFSLRRHDGKVNLPGILHEMMKNLPNMVGGGHRPASGAKCKQDDYEKFKEMFVELHPKYKSN